MQKMCSFVNVLLDFVLMFFIVNFTGVVFKSNISDVLGTDKQFYVSPVPTEKSTSADELPIDKYGYLG